MKRESIHISDIDWHRNGISGEGFHVVRFIYEGRWMIATVFEARGHVAVVDVNDLSNHYRGDVFERALRGACRRFDRDRTDRHMTLAV
jgi:hypothetical protein